jgi:hypothetical protein
VSVEGHYRLLSHDEKGEAVYAKLTTNGVEWVRAWREATTFLTSASADEALHTSRLSEPERDVKVTQRFYDWQAWKKPAEEKPKARRGPKGAKKPATMPAPAPDVSGVGA